MIKTLDGLNERLDTIERENAFAAMLTERVVGKVSIHQAVKVGQRFDSLELQQRREIVRGLFSRIEISKAGRGYRPPIENRVRLILASGFEYRMS